MSKNPNYRYCLACDHTPTDNTPYCGECYYTGKAFNHLYRDLLTGLAAHNIKAWFEQTGGGCQTLYIAADEYRLIVGLAGWAFSDWEFWQGVGVLAHPTPYGLESADEHANTCPTCDAIATATDQLNTPTEDWSPATSEVVTYLTNCHNALQGTLRRYQH